MTIKELLKDDVDPFGLWGEITKTAKLKVYKDGEEQQQPIPDDQSNVAESDSTEVKTTKTPSQLPQDVIDDLLSQDMTTTDSEGNVTGKLTVEDQKKTDFTKKDLDYRIRVNNMLEEIMSNDTPKVINNETVKEGAISINDLVQASFHDELEKLSRTLKITQSAANFLKGLAKKVKGVGKKVDKAAKKVEDTKIIVKKPVKVIKRQGRPPKQSVKELAGEAVKKVKAVATTAVERSKKSIKSIAKRVKFQKPISIEKGTKKVTKEVKKVVKKSKPKVTKKVSVKKAPVKAKPVKKAPVKAKPAKKAPVKSKPAKKAPVNKKTTKKAPPMAPPKKGLLTKAPVKGKKKGKVIKITKKTTTKTKTTYAEPKKKSLAIPLTVAGVAGAGTGYALSNSGGGQSKAASVMNKLSEQLYTSDGIPYTDQTYTVHDSTLQKNYNEALRQDEMNKYYDDEGYQKATHYSGALDGFESWMKKSNPGLAVNEKTPEVPKLKDMPFGSQARIDEYNKRNWAMDETTHPKAKVEKETKKEGSSKADFILKNAKSVDLDPKDDSM
jgi:hypothetical protein